ncbi:type IV toxin-antitoxin system AbiEi family antitoxin [Polaromonas sp. YR568]|uniref:type IV toxin-antitoxin system AbiEi family antitoxin n=1 Tax=Polaromonas sp. YR568 TaxID=1855301 RepID=UPI00398BD68A
MDQLIVIERAVEALKPFGIEALEVAKPESAMRAGVDAWLRMGKGREQVDYAAVVQRKLTPATLGAASMRLEHIANAADCPTLLLTDYLTPPMAEKLHARKQQFADTAGNAYLDAPGLLVYVMGRKLQGHATAPAAGKAHTLTGLKVMFALLCDPELADAPQRAIAAAAGVALGAIPAVMADMQQNGHLLVQGKRRRLNANKRLLDEWALAYARRLRAKTLQAIYTVTDFEGWKTWPLDLREVLWGAEPAADLLVNYLRPGVLTLYAGKIPPRLLVEKKMKLASGARPDDRTIEWRKPFWGKVPVAARPDTVHPVLVYADLLATGDARCMETAQLVYDEYLARLLPAA